ncbi:hypothetical protein PO908_02705 [Streptococcus anginosus]|uniref:hypothetical protein n=1 Tax=Streptococcus anginosus TaxID=1328 RepID=UPI00374A87DB
MRKRPRFIHKLLEKTGQAGFNALIAQGGDALRRLTQETNNAKGATKRMSDQMMESSENQLKKAQAELEVSWN